VVKNENRENSGTAKADISKNGEIGKEGEDVKREGKKNQDPKINPGWRADLKS
jgi:hypothetical protein